MPGGDSRYEQSTETDLRQRQAVAFLPKEPACAQSGPSTSGGRRHSWRHSSRHTCWQRCGTRPRLHRGEQRAWTAAHQSKVQEERKCLPRLLALPRSSLSPLSTVAKPKCVLSSPAASRPASLATRRTAVTVQACDWSRARRARPVCGRRAKKDDAIAQALAVPASLSEFTDTYGILFRWARCRRIVSSGVLGDGRYLGAIIDCTQWLRSWV